MHERSEAARLREKMKMGEIRLGDFFFSIRLDFQLEC